MALGLVVAGGDPVRQEVAERGVACGLIGELEDQCPGVVARAPAAVSRLEGEQVAEIDAENLRAGLRGRFIVRPRLKLTVTPRALDGRQFPIEKKVVPPTPR